MKKTLENYPQLKKEFHPSKNENLKPEHFTKGSDKKIWWKCTKDHEWQAIVGNRTRGQNCPYCSGKRVSKENNLKVLFPKLAKEWHPTKNKKNKKKKNKKPKLHTIEDILKVFKDE